VFLVSRQFPPFRSVLALRSFSQAFPFLWDPPWFFSLPFSRKQTKLWWPGSFPLVSSYPPFVRTFPNTGNVRAVFLMKSIRGVNFQILRAHLTLVCSTGCLPFLPRTFSGEKRPPPDFFSFHPKSNVKYIFLVTIPAPICPYLWWSDGEK